MALLALLAPAALAVSDAAPPVGAPRPAVDLVLIVDTSASMVGKGGKGGKGAKAAVIFPAVQEAAKDLIEWTAPGDQVVLMSYDDRVRADPTVSVQSEREQRHLAARIDALQAKGKWTYTAAALRDAFVEAKRLDDVEGAGAGPPRTKVIILMTDGKNEPPPHDTSAAVNLDEVARNYSDQPWFVWQVQLGPNLDAGVSSALKGMSGYREAKVEGGKKLSAFVREEIIREAEAVLRRAAVSLQPSALALGARTAGETASAELTITAAPAGVPGRIRLRADATPAGARVSIDPAEVTLGGGSARATVNVALAPELAASGLTGFIAAEVVEGPLDLTVTAVPWSVSVAARSRAVRVEPATLRFDPLRPGERDSAEITLLPEAGHAGGRIALAAEGAPAGVQVLVEPAELTLAPGADSRARVSIEVTDGAAPGAAAGSIALRVTDGPLTLTTSSLAWSATVEPPPDPLVRGLWIGTPLVLLLAGLGAWWWARRPRLHGQLRYWTPGQQPVTKDLASLTRAPLFGTHRIRLGDTASSEIALANAGGKSAVVSAVRQDGVTLCVIEPSPTGEVTFQNRRVTQLELYDRDQFSFAGYTFEYRSDDVSVRPRTRV